MQRGYGVAIGSEVETNGLSGVPVGGDLKDGGAAQATMGEEHFFTKRIFTRGSYHLGGHPREFGIALMIGAMEDERDEGGTSGNDIVAKLPGEVVAEGGGAHLRDGEATGGNNQYRSAKFGGAGAKNEFGDAGDFGDACV